MTHYIERLRDGDAQAAEQIWKCYVEKLLRLARSRLNGIPDKGFDEEDIIVSVFDRFFSAARHNRFARLQDRDDLWQILVMLTERNVADRYRAATAEKRGGFAGLQQPLLDDSNSAAWTDKEPPPEVVAMLNENLARALGKLEDETVREVAILRMEGYQHREIAERLDISLSSVERKLRVVRTVWQEEFGDASLSTTG